MKVIIADDHPLYRDALSRLVSSIQNDAEVIDVSSCKELIALVKTDSNNIDLVLLDLGMPNEDSFLTIEQIHQSQPSIAIIVVSGTEIAEDTRRAIAAGALGFIPKSLDSASFVTTVQHILSGGVSVIPPLSQNISTSKANDKPRLPDENQHLDKLTQRQNEVLKLLSCGDTNKMIANKLGLTEGTVKLHVRDILQRLDATNRTQAVIIAKNTENQ